MSPLTLIHIIRAAISNALNRSINVLTIAPLVVLLCLPVYGPGYFSDYLSTVEANHAGFVCDHADADSDHESQDGHQKIVHCHELDTPGDITSATVVEHLPVISTLTSSDEGTPLDGYGAPFEIPPEHRG